MLKNKKLVLTAIAIIITIALTTVFFANSRLTETTDVSVEITFKKYKILESEIIVEPTSQTLQEVEVTIISDKTSLTVQYQLGNNGEWKNYTTPLKIQSKTILNTRYVGENFEGPITSKEITVGVAATTTVNGTTTNYLTVQEAIDAAGTAKDAVVKLARNESVTNIVIDENQDIIFDLNGNTLDKKVIQTADIKEEIIKVASTQPIMLLANNTSEGSLIVNNGTLEITGSAGKITSSVNTVKNNGNLKVSGNCVIESTSVHNQDNIGSTATIDNYGQFEQNGGTIISVNSCPIFNEENGFVKVEDGNVTGRKYGIRNLGEANTEANPAVVVNGGTFLCTDGNAINNRSKSGLMVINDGEINGVVTAATPTVLNYSGKIIINGGTITSDTERGIYQYTGNGTVEMRGGNVTGARGAGVKEGELKILGGIIKGTVVGVYTNESTGVLTIGSKNNTADVTTPVIQCENIAVTNNSGTFNFYDGILKGGIKSITGTVTDKEEGYELLNGTEKIDGTTYETSTLYFPIDITYDENYYSNNLWEDTTAINKYKYWSASPSSVVNGNLNTAHNGQYVKATMNAGAGGMYYTTAEPLVEGKEYTWSVYVKANRNIHLYNIGHEQGGVVSGGVTLNTEWKKVTHTFTAIAKEYNNFIFYAYEWNSGDEIYIHSLEIMEGKPTHNVVSTTENKQLGTLTTPIRTGYTFDGWYTKPTGGEKVSSTTIVPKQNKVTYYAHWTVDTFTFKIDPNGGTYNGSTNTITQTNAFGSKVNMQVPTRTGYTFGGWVATKVAGTDNSTWVEVFYHNVNGGKKLFTSNAEVLSTNSNYKYSILEQLEKFRYTTDSEFEFLLEYEDLPGEYNRWKQTSNPTTSTTVTGYVANGISWTRDNWGGLALSSNEKTFIDGSPGADTWYCAIGANTLYRNGMPGNNPNLESTEKSVTLWVKANTDLSNILENVSGVIDANNNYTVKHDVTLKAVWLPNNYQNTTSSAYYSTLKMAISNSATGTTIKPLKDVTEIVVPTVEQGKSIKLDLNGKTITFNNVGVTNDGTLEVTGTNGKITSNTRTIINNGTLKISNNCEIEGTEAESTSIPVILNYGEFELNGANITAIARHAIYNVSNGYINIKNGNVSAGRVTILNEGTRNTEANPAVLIENGKISSTGSNVISNEQGAGLIVINDGEITRIGEGGSPAVINNSGKIIINGGNIISQANRAVLQYINNGAIEIRGGTCKGALFGAGVQDGELKILGGTIIGNNYGAYAITDKATLIIGSKDNESNLIKPVIQSTNIGVINDVATFKFYDGVIKGTTGKSIVGTINDKEEGYEILKGTETIDGITYETSTLYFPIEITYDENYYSNNFLEDTTALNKYTSWSTKHISIEEGTLNTAYNGQYIKATMNAGTNGGLYYAAKNALVEGKEYTWSVYVKANRNINLYRIGHEQGGGISSGVTINTEWQKITHTFTATAKVEGSYNLVFFSGEWKTGDEIYVHSLEIIEGKPTHNIVSTTENKQLGTLTTPIRTGYTFDGWYTKPTGGEKVSSTTVVPKQNKVTYYAHWTVDTFTFKIDPNGGTYKGSTNIITQTNAFGSKVNMETPTKTGYTFGGWVPTKVAGTDNSTWVEVFYHNVNGGKKLFTSDAEVLATDSNYKYSILGQLEKFRYTTESEFEFLLEYEDLPGEYNRWIQTSNPTTSTTVTGYVAKGISWTSQKWGGLALSNQAKTLIDGSPKDDTWFYAIGVNYIYQKGMPAEGNKLISTDKSVTLWVKANTDLSNILENVSGVIDANNNYTVKHDVTLKAVWIPNNYQNTTSSAYYPTLDIAVRKSATGTTVKALNNVTETLAATVEQGKSIKLDLNGKTITFSNVGVTNNGTLEVTGTSGTLTSNTNTITNSATGTFTKSGACTITGTSGSYSTFLNYGTATFSEGTVSGSTYNAVYNESTGKVIVAGATLTSARYAIHNYGTATGTTSPSIKITSGTVKSTGSNAILNAAAGEVTITGGIILGGTIVEKNASGIYCASGKLTIGTNETTPSVSTTTPLITGSAYGVNVESAVTFNFYDGIIMGIANSIYGTVDTKTTGYAIVPGTKTENSVTYKTAVLGPSVPVITAKYTDANGATYPSGTWTNKNVYITLKSASVGKGIKRYEWKEGEDGEWKVEDLVTSNNVGTGTWTKIRNSTIYFRAIDNNDVISETSSIVIRKETTAPTLSLSRQGTVNGFKGWKLNGSATIDATNQIATINATSDTIISPYMHVDEKYYGWSFDAYTETALTDKTTGGTLTNTGYYDTSFAAIKGSNGYTANGQNSNIPLNTWTTVKQNNYNYGTGIEYLKLTIYGSSTYSLPPVKYKNMKIYGDIYAKTNYTINVTASDSNSGSGISVRKYAEGSKDASYFASSGTTFTGTSFTVTKNATYTVYIKDAAGNEKIATITIDKIDNTAPSIASLTASSSNATTNTLTAKATDSVSGIVAYQFTSTNVEPTSWKIIKTQKTEFTATHTVSANGTYYVWFVDSAGNVSSKSVTVSNVTPASSTSSISTGLDDDQLLLNNNINMPSYSIGITTPQNTTTNNQLQQNIQQQNVQIGNTYYTTLQDAINEANNGVTIKILKNINTTEQITIPENKTITINTNGKTITSTAVNTINNKGNLIITGIGTIKNEKENGNVIINKGELTVDNGNIITVQNGGKAIYNEGTNVIIKSGKIRTEGIGAIAIYNASLAKLNIQDGIIETTGFNSKGIYNNSELEITGGKIIVSGDDSIGLYNADETTKCEVENIEILVEAEIIENYDLIKNTDEFKAELEEMKSSYGIYNDTLTNIQIKSGTIIVERLKGIGIRNSEIAQLTLGNKEDAYNEATPIIYAISDNTLAIVNDEDKNEVNKTIINMYDGKIISLISMKKLITNVLENYEIVEEIGQQVVNTYLRMLETMNP